MPYRIISTDSHVNEPMDLWQKRLPAELRDAGFRVVDSDDGGQGWTAEGSKPFVFGLGAVAQAGADFNKFKARGVRFADLPPGNYDPVEHLKDQDRDNVDASVMYPGQGMKLPQLKDKALRDLVNVEWIRLFPDENDRPVRHTVEGDFAGNRMIQLEILAVLRDEAS